jgi:hypothetical protein
MAGTAWRAASEIIKSRRLLKKGSAPTRSAPIFRCARVTNARVDVEFTAGVHNLDLLLECARRCQHFTQLNFRIRSFRVYEHSERCGS